MPDGTRLHVDNVTKNGDTHGVGFHAEQIDALILHLIVNLQEEVAGVFAACIDSVAVNYFYHRPFTVYLQ